MLRFIAAGVLLFALAIHFSAYTDDYEDLGDWILISLLTINVAAIFIDKNAPKKILWSINLISVILFFVASTSYDHEVDIYRVKFFRGYCGCFQVSGELAGMVDWVNLVALLTFIVSGILILIRAVRVVMTKT